jgi:hypothetical protein
MDKLPCILYEHSDGNSTILYPICPTVSHPSATSGDQYINLTFFQAEAQRPSAFYGRFFLRHLKFSTDSEAPSYHPAGRRLRIDSTLFCRIRDLSLLLPPRIISIFRCSLIMLLVYWVEHEVSCTSSDWIDLGAIVCLSRQT